MANDDAETMAPREYREKHVKPAIREMVKRLIYGICNTGNMSQSALAERAGVKKCQVTRWLQGKTTPTEAHVKKLEAVYEEVKKMNQKEGK